jgi:phospho-N-acetylmuramoyl-pentapeptide-transferase
MILATAAFLVALAAEPLLFKLLKYLKLGKQIRDEASAPIFAKLHAAKTGTPVGGGILIWGTVLVAAFAFSLLANVFRGEPWLTLNFLSRKETLLPLGAMFFSALLGLVDDYLNVRKIGPHGGGLGMRQRLFSYALIATVCAWWFYVKLGWDTLHIPFVGDVTLGLWMIPFSILVIVATAFSVNEIDGLDGLSGGTLLAAFAAFGGIAFVQGKYDLASLTAVIVGALLAFLWFNIHPAKFFMGDTGAMSLGVTLAIIAMLTNSTLLLPVIGVLFLVESLSVIIQVASKKLRHGQKVFRSAPIHHHLQTLGWPEPTIVMRFWVIGAMAAAIGLVLALLDRAY